MSTGETYMLGDAENLNDVESESFDIAASYIVLVDLLDYRSAIGGGIPRPAPRWSLRSLQHPPHAEFTARRLD